MKKAALNYTALINAICKVTRKKPRRRRSPEEEEEKEEEKEEEEEEEDEVGNWNSRSRQKQLNRSLTP